jgi:DNA replication protein DnaC
MYQYGNLSDFEFELLCRDIMERKLGCPLRCFAPGRDGGVDITETKLSGKHMVQVKHYIDSPYRTLLSSLKRELPKVKQKQPEHYYVCCAKQLTAQNISEIYQLFSDYMDDAEAVVDLMQIDNFLHKKENADILERHYKLWLESTSVLEQLGNQDIAIDCDAFFYQIEKEQKLFVKTKYYEEGRQILENEHMLMLLGDPGVGKTMLTKMLALAFVAEGYRIRYTTNGELSDLKRALSADRKRKELIVLDDCLGQHYFKMQETKENELLALVKYIMHNPNKLLIMNSRVTIFHEARERSCDFRYFMDDENIKIRKLEMNGLDEEEKGWIFYNHLYFSGIPEEYYQNISKDRRYRTIVRHPNYTPRLVEFVTKKKNYEQVAPDCYATFIMDCLRNPTELWKDEFTRKLGAEDRALLLTLYSLTDTSVEEPVLVRAFLKRLSGLEGMDTTRNLYEEALRRLTDSMVQLMEQNGRKRIGVCNPSINDFLKNYIRENPMEQANMPAYATEYVQLERICPDRVEEFVRNGQIYQYHFSMLEEMRGKILEAICNREIRDICHTEFVQAFLKEPGSCYTDKGDKSVEILFALLQEKMDAFYHTRENLEQETLEEFLMELDLWDYELIAREAKKTGGEWLFTKYRKSFERGLQNAVEAYARDVDQSDYYDGYDVNTAIEESTFYNGEALECDFSSAALEWEERIREDIYDEIMGIVNKFPVEIAAQIVYDPGDADISTSLIESYLEDWTKPDDYNDDPGRLVPGGNETAFGGGMLDVIFRGKR